MDKIRTWMSCVPTTQYCNLTKLPVESVLLLGHRSIHSFLVLAQAIVVIQHQQWQWNFNQDSRHGLQPAGSADVRFAPWKLFARTGNWVSESANQQCAGPSCKPSAQTKPWHHISTLSKRGQARSWLRAMITWQKQTEWNRTDLLCWVNKHGKASRLS